MKTLNLRLTRLSAVAAVTASAALAYPALGQVTLYDNNVPPAVTGGMSTGATAENGTAAPAGSTWSELQHDVGNTTATNNTLGVSDNFDAGTAQPVGGIRLADDFIVPNGQQWLLERIWVYSYTTAQTAMTYDDARLRIWNGQPGVLGSVVIYGDLTTNRRLADSDALIHRTGPSVINCVAPCPNTTRRVKKIEVSTTTPVAAGAPLVLNPGKYWIEWNTSNSANTAHFSPHATVTGARAIAGANARQFLGAPPGAWVALIDTGVPAAAPDIPQDMAFQVRGTVILGACDIPLRHCAADNAPPPKGNNVINVDDLLGVINSWGGTGLAPKPQGDVAPPPNGNCIVNVDDLLAVINNWGPCPPPTGGCCQANGVCAQLTELVCTTNGGTYLGNAQPCAGVVCPIPPANDLCTNRILVGNGTTAWNNHDATLDPFFSPKCDVSISRDIWFNYTATCTGAVTIDTVGSTGATDTIVAVYNGWGCPPGTFIACNDDISPVAPLNRLSRVQAPVVLGQQIKIRVGVFGATADGAGLLNIACTANDSCEGAIALSLPGTHSGSLLNATSDPATPICGFGQTPATRGKWYSVMGNGNTLTATTCASPAEPNPLAFDMRIQVYCGSSCTDLSCVTVAFFDSCNFLHETVTWCSTAGQKYLIYLSTESPIIDPPNPDPLQLYTIDVSSDAVLCTGAVACGCFVCPLGSEQENEPLLCDSVPGDVTNAGCNITPAVFGAVTVNGPAKCGLGSTFLSTVVPPAVPGQNRDTDWYMFTTAGGVHHIEVNAKFTALVGFVQNVSPCAAAAFVTGSTVTTTTTCTTVSSPPVTLVAGTFAAFVGPSVFNGFPCSLNDHEYWMSVKSP